VIHNLLKQNGIDSPSQWDSRDPRLLKRGILFSKDEKGSSSEMIHAYSTGHSLQRWKGKLKRGASGVYNAGKDGNVKE